MIYLASDHRGVELKEKIKIWLKEWAIECEDVGPYNAEPSVDYPDFVGKAAAKVSADPQNARAIVLGHSGNGEAVAANKFKGVRTTVFYGGPEEILRLGRDHNDANVLSLGASFVDAGKIKDQIKKWLDTPFSGDERHVRRLKKIGEIEQNN